MGVLVVRVDPSEQTPHVTSDGRIYTRIGASSRPVNERVLVDQLFQRRKKAEDRVTAWLRQDSGKSAIPRDADSGYPYLRIVTSLNPWKPSHHHDRLYGNQMRDLLREESTAPTSSSNLPFNHVYRTGNGIVARQAGMQDAAFAALTWHLRTDGSTDFTTWLNWTTWSRDGLPDRPMPWDRYVHRAKFDELMRDAGYRFVSVIDFSPLMCLMVAWMEKYCRILEMLGDECRFHAKFSLERAARSVPFVDSPVLLDYFDAYGIPFTLYESVMSPPGRGPDTFYEVDAREKTYDWGELTPSEGMGAVTCATHVGGLIGLPLLSQMSWGESESDYAADWVDAGRRATVSAPISGANR